MLTLKNIAALDLESVEWDAGRGSVSGFGARRQKGASVTYVLKYRTAEGRQRWHTIGKHGAPWTPDTAREEAKKILGLVARGDDPAAKKIATRRAETVAELCDAYISAAEEGRLLTKRRAPKKASTLATDKGRVERHIKPLLGNLKVAAVKRRDVENFRDDVANGKTAVRIKTGKHGLARVTGGRGTSTRTMALLGVIFSYAEHQGLRADNPVHGIETHAYAERLRRFSDDEFAAIGKALEALPTAWPMALAGTRFLALTGWRRGEMLALRWEDLDIPNRTVFLPDTKTGRSMRPLSAPACDLLQKLDRLGPLVFPASTDAKRKKDDGNTPPAFDKPMAGFQNVWRRVATKAELPADCSPHVFRHSFASVAADLGYSELTIAALIGHKKASITSKYTHHADAVLLAAADAVASAISNKLQGG
ncbi:hypothetical protein CCR94_01925 [Rhodoblastus sphagnicola]|uniref:Tyr recombinase domain-containing protein n=2 Tax=Rhodoblastus sphagnicola TaxID=333368 RepID=A0A2S6NFI2_9HYPH|nr:site-specific integrase [Rhodoblastus sphagnicola]PPQ33381.1 hypothetical protein CCR94_01925 [Rhodoblastus sphagnicola]